MHRKTIDENTREILAQFIDRLGMIKFPSGQQKLTEVLDFAQKQAQILVGFCPTTKDGKTECTCDLDQLRGVHTEGIPLPALLFLQRRIRLECSLSVRYAVSGLSDLFMGQRVDVYPTNNMDRAVKPRRGTILGVDTDGSGPVIAVAIDHEPFDPKTCPAFRPAQVRLLSPIEALRDQVTQLYKRLSGVPDVSGSRPRSAWWRTA